MPQNPEMEILVRKQPPRWSRLQMWFTVRRQAGREQVQRNGIQVLEWGWFSGTNPNGTIVEWYSSSRVGLFLGQS